MTLKALVAEIEAFQQYYNKWTNFKALRHKAVSPPHTDGSVVFAGWRQCALQICGGKAH